MRMRKRLTHADLGAYLTASGLTQTQFAAALGVSQPTISRAVRGRGVHPALALRIARVARVPLSSLVSCER